MALINCPECGKDIASTAPSCIHCGTPIASRTTSGRVPYSDQEVALMLDKKPKTNHVLHLLLCIPTMGLWLIMWALVVMSNNSEANEIDRKIKEGKPPE